MTNNEFQELTRFLDEKFSQIGAGPQNKNAGRRLSNA